jgi:hypothetical protein
MLSHPVLKVLETMEIMINKHHKYRAILENELSIETDKFFADKMFFEESHNHPDFLLNITCKMRRESSNVIACYILLDETSQEIITLGESYLIILKVSGNTNSAILEWILGDNPQIKRIHICDLCWLYAI